MKKRIIAIGLTAVFLFCGCNRGGVDVVINADGYDGIVLNTEATVVTPMSIPDDIPTAPIITETTTGEDTPTETVTAETTTTKPYITSTTPPKVTTASTKKTTPPVTTTEITTTEVTTTEITTTEIITTEVTTTEVTTVSETTTSSADTNTDLTPIMGNSVATAEQMTAYIKKINPNVAQSVIDMIPYYLSEGEAEGVRGDIAFAQSCVETANFRFNLAGTGSAVTIDQNNFCGMGVTQLGLKGNSFDTPQLGIRAQIQHLKAYGSTESLNGEQVDPRFQYVSRGSAVYVEWLGIQENPDHRGWAGGKNYGPIIMGILDKILAM